MDGITRRDFAVATGTAALGEIMSSQAARAGDETTPSTNEGSTLDIKRIRIIEPASGIPCISLATVHGGHVYLCGVTADPAQLGGIKEQTSQVLGRIDRLLAAAGTDKSKLLSAQVWLTDMGLFAEHNDAWNAWVDQKNPPVRACLHSPALWRPGLLVEIMATAIL